MNLSNEMRDKVDIIVRGGFIITEDSFDRVIEDGAVAIAQKRIVAVDKSHRILARFKAEETIEIRHSVIMPGFVNAHMHETLIRGFWDIFGGKELYDLLQMAYFMELCVSGKHVIAAAKLNQLEMIKNGTTCFLDIWRHPIMAAKTLQSSGLRAVLAPQIADVTPWKPIHNRQYWMESVEDAEIFVREWNGLAEGRINAWFGPHAPYSCSDETLAKVRDLASKYNVGIHIHLSEGLNEVEDIKKKKGMTPVRWLEKIGFLGSDVHAAHCVWLDDEEIGLLKQRGVSVAHLPRSNMKSGMGVAPLMKLLEEGVTVGLGTDSNMGPGNLDMFEEMRAACYLHRLVNHDSRLLPASKLLELATIGSAKCLRLDRIIGSLEVGKKADIIILELGKPHLTPLPKDPNNIKEIVVFSARAEDISTTIVDGKVLMKNRKVLTLNEEQTILEAREAADDLMELTLQAFKTRSVEKIF
jgi:5-methylthioadenosine/S-adenosylhomocysteine deaminase